LFDNRQVGLQPAGFFMFHFAISVLYDIYSQRIVHADLPAQIQTYFQGAYLGCEKPGNDLCQKTACRQNR
jgi:hypothetical protein